MPSILSGALMGIFILSGSSATTTVANIFGNPAAPAQTYSVSMTGYNAVPSQTDDSPMTTASGAFSNADIVAARSVDLAGELPFGTVIEITPGEDASPSCGISLVRQYIGLRVIADSMHPRKRNQIDILFAMNDSVGGRGIHNPAEILGVCKDVQIKVVGHVDVKDMPKTQGELAIRVGKFPALASAK